METGHDLIFRWVPRMVIFGIYRTGNIPFHTVYLHGLVNDAQGKKMSKSKGNVINPLALSEKYGTDALRMGLIVGNTPGTDLALSEEKIRGYKNFANKIWNASRFVLSNIENLDPRDAIYADADAKKIEELRRVTKEIEIDMENFKYYLAAEKIYHYFWHMFADKIIEESKISLLAHSTDERRSTQKMLYEILSVSLKLLHPFMPFVTERIWRELPQASLPAQAGKKLLIIEEWPKA